MLNASAQSSLTGKPNRFRSFSCFALFALSFGAFLSAQQVTSRPSPQRLVTQFVDDAVRTTLPHNVHPLARKEFDQGEVPATLPLNRMVLVLKRSPELETALASLLEAQQDIHSTSYHQWLTPQQFGEQFGPAAEDVDAVTQWLTSSGFQVTQVSRSHLFVEFSGNAQSVRQAFGTSIHTFMVNGEQHHANVGNPTIPSVLASVVAGVNSLHDFQKQAQNIPLGIHPARSRSLASPAYTFGGSSTQIADYAVTPYDFATIYDLLPLWTATPIPINGSGQSIAIVGRSDINPSDAPAFWNFFGLDGTHAPQPKLVVTYNGPNPGITADESEADIDTQLSGAVAPGATVNLVVSASTATTDGVDLSALYVVDNNLATVLSESYGACELSMGSGGVQFYGSLWQQAAAQGISVFVSSGDSGAAGCDNPVGPAGHGLQVSGIASTPFNAAVGGTDFNQYQTWATYWNATNNAVTKQSAKGYIPETTWNSSCTNAVFQFLSGGSTNPETNCNNSSFKSYLDSNGGGGGPSSTWLKPTWQTGTTNDNARDIPDVSLFASNGFLNSYYLVCQSDAYPNVGGCQSGSFQGFGGTSISSPQFAGIMALINQKTGSAQGIPGLTLYKLAAQHPSAFHDIPAGSSISMPCVTGTLNCATSNAGDAYGTVSGYNTGVGYDLATGLGSVDVANLVNQWQSVSFTPSATALSMNGGATVNFTHGATIPFSVNVSPTAATGEVALMVAPGTPGDPGIASFPLTLGMVATSTSLLPGGSYSVLAHYSGDSTYGGSYSNSVAVTISPETSAAFVNLVTSNANGVLAGYSASSATYGSGYQYLRVDVGDVSASVSPSTGISSQCSRGKESCPTGKVVFSAPGTSLDGLSLQLNNEGYVQIAAPGPGTYVVTAIYQGDASFGRSTSTATFTIAKAPGTVSANVLGLPVSYGNQEQIVAGVVTKSNGIAPTGTFQFYVDSNALLAPQPVYENSGYGGVFNGTAHYATADASTSTSFLGLGNHTITAQYSGDANYAAGISLPTSFTVVQAAPTFLGFGVSNPAGGSVVAGQGEIASATLLGAPPGVPPTGSITFYNNRVAIPGTVTYISSTSQVTLTASLATTFPTLGTYPITVSYSGDSNYSSTTNPSHQSLVVVGPVSVNAGAGIVIASPGLSGSTTVSAIPNGGFSGAVTLSCTPDPSAKETTCVLTSGATSGSTIQLSVGGSALPVGLSVTTTASHLVGRRDPPPLRLRSEVIEAAALALLIPVFSRRRKRVVRIVALALTLGLSACGGSSGGGGSGGSITDPGTPLGTYLFTVTASTGSGTNVFTTTAQQPVTIN